MSDPGVETNDLAEGDESRSLEEGQLLDYITDEPVKDTPKERVRQRIARASTVTLLRQSRVTGRDSAPRC